MFLCCRLDKLLSHLIASGFAESLQVAWILYNHLYTISVFLPLDMNIIFISI